jgi:hypothetical protein
MGGGRGVDPSDLSDLQPVDLAPGVARGRNGAPSPQVRRTRSVGRGGSGGSIGRPNPSVSRGASGSPPLRQAPPPGRGGGGLDEDLEDEEKLSNFLFMQQILKTLESYY